MENTKENKARFFALYWGFKCLRNELLNDNIPAHKVDTSNCKGLPQQYLELTPLSQISDEDALELAMIIYGHLDSKLYHNKETGRELIARFFKREVVFYPILVNEAVDYLRSRGYALPWMGLSVEQLIEYGWVKLKSE